MRTRAVRVSITMLMLSVALLAGGQSASAASTRTWTGMGTSDHWSDAANWDIGVPVAGDSLVFPASASRKANTNDLAPNTSFGTVTFNGAGYVIDGNGFQVSTSLVNQPGTGTNRLSLSLGGGGEVAQQSGKLILDHANSYTGDTTVMGGVLAISDDDALGGTANGTTVSAGATLQLLNGIEIGAERVIITGEGFDGYGALQSISGTNYVDDLRILDATVIGVGNSVLVVATLSQQAPGASFTLVGGGKMQVDDAFFAGNATVEDGNLTYNASSQLFTTVEEDGLMRGTGTIGSLDVFGGVVWPGSGNQPGILTVMGGASISAGQMRFDLDGPAAGTGYGRLAAQQFSLDTNVTSLQVDLAYQPVIGQVFRIVDNGAGHVGGTFFGLPEGAIFFANGFGLEVSYVGGDGNDVTLTVLRKVAANLEVTLTAQPSPVAAGHLLVYTATVTNLGPDASQSSRLSMGTPVGTTFGSVTAAAGWTCSMPSPSVSLSCTISTLAAGDSATFSLTYQVDPGASGTISATAGVSAKTDDPFSGNNSANVLTPVGAGGGRPYRLFVPGLAADSAGAPVQPE
ncbi:MAG: autotransporter-associated beta strand repeat-containing protein [Dehalococcoidia bacterium]